MAALLERIPILGLVFSISNRVAACSARAPSSSFVRQNVSVQRLGTRIVWAHDLEKRQNAFRDGSLKPEKIYDSKTAKIAPSDLPESFGGSFPRSKILERKGITSDLTVDATTEDTKLPGIVDDMANMQKARATGASTSTSAETNTATQRRAVPPPPCEE